MRIGLTFAKVLGWAKNIKVVPFSSLELLASTDTNKINIPILDARRGYVYAGCYDTNLSSLFKDTYISIDELNDKLKDIKNIQYISCDELEGYIEIPPEDKGDYAFPCFRLAKELKKAPQAIAEELKTKIREYLNSRR